MGILIERFYSRVLFVVSCAIVPFTIHTFFCFVINFVYLKEMDFVINIYDDVFNGINKCIEC